MVRAMLSVLASVALAARVNEVHKAGQPGSVSCAFPKNLADKYSSPRIAGSGATACVFLADNADGQTVAIKVKKGTSSISRASWEKECETLQQMRRRACSIGDDVHDLAETFIPTCLDSGSNFYVMSAAGTTGIEKKVRLPLESQLTLFAQMIGSVYALHATGFTHNDLHGMNLVMDDAENLAVIDFGELQPHHSDTGLKHDINGVWKWTAQLAVCPSAAYPGYRGFGFAAQNQAKGAFLQCLKNNWEVDPESLETISQVLNNAIYKNKNQMLKEFWETPFVQKQDARVTKKFAWSEMEGCREWDWQEIKGVIECKDVPGFIGQCPIESRPGGCYNTVGAWSCWTDGVDFWKGQCNEQGYEGACQYSDYGKTLSQETLPTCASLDVCEQQCATKPGMFGACYTTDRAVPGHNKCHCVKNTNKWQIEKSLLKGGCQTKKIPGVAKTYEGLCVYGDYAVVDKDTTTPPPFDVFGVAITTTTPVPTLAPGEKKYAVGDVVEAQNSKGVWKKAEIVARGVGKVKVHYVGFNKRFDFWEPELSSRIRTN